MNPGYDVAAKKIDIHELNYYKYTGCFKPKLTGRNLANLINCAIAAPITGYIPETNPLNSQFYCVKCLTDKNYVKLFTEPAQEYNLVSYNWKNLSAGKKFGYLYHGFTCFDNAAVSARKKYLSTNGPSAP